MTGFGDEESGEKKQLVPESETSQVIRRDTEARATGKNYNNQLELEVKDSFSEMMKLFIDLEKLAKSIIKKKEVSPIDKFETQYRDIKNRVKEITLKINKKYPNSFLGRVMNLLTRFTERLVNFIRRKEIDTKAISNLSEEIGECKAKIEKLAEQANSIQKTHEVFLDAMHQEIRNILDVQAPSMSAKDELASLVNIQMGQMKILGDKKLTKITELSNPEMSSRPNTPPPLPPSPPPPPPPSPPPPPAASNSQGSSGPNTPPPPPPPPGFFDMKDPLATLGRKIKVRRTGEELTGVTNSEPQRTKPKNDLQAAIAQAIKDGVKLRSVQPRQSVHSTGSSQNPEMNELQTKLNKQKAKADQNASISNSESEVESRPAFFVDKEQSRTSSVSTTTHADRVISKRTGRGTKGFSI